MRYRRIINLLLEDVLNAIIAIILKRLKSCNNVVVFDSQRMKMKMQFVNDNASAKKTF